MYNWHLFSASCSLQLCSSTVCVSTQQLRARLSPSCPSRGSPPRPGGPCPPGCSPGRSLHLQGEVEECSPLMGRMESNTVAGVYFLSFSFHFFLFFFLFGWVLQSLCSFWFAAIAPCWTMLILEWYLILSSQRHRYSLCLYNNSLCFCQLSPHCLLHPLLYTISIHFFLQVRHNSH